ncbi:hypothetical protein PPYR_08673, partial [Photinus pyralis]
NKDGVKFERSNVNNQLDTIVTIPYAQLKENIPHTLRIEETSVANFGEATQYDLLLDKEGRSTIKLTVPKGKSPTVVTIKKDGNEIIATSSTNIDPSTAAVQASGGFKLETTKKNDAYVAKVTLPFSPTDDSSELAFVFEGAKDVDNIPPGTTVAIDDLSTSK